jgi:hypothetical protein
MPKLSDLAIRTLSPPNYRFTSEAVKAVQVHPVMLEDNVVDLSRESSSNPKYRDALADDFLMLNDVVIGLDYSTLNARSMNAVGIYHPTLPPFPEPVTLAPRTMAFRAANLGQAVSILAALIYRIDARMHLGFNEVRAMPVALLTDEQVVKFLDLLKTAHEMRTSMRKRDKLMRELIPATIQKFFNDNAGHE